MTTLHPLIPRAPPTHTFPPPRPAMVMMQVMRHGAAHPRYDAGFRPFSETMEDRL